MPLALASMQLLSQIADSMWITSVVNTRMLMETQHASAFCNGTFQRQANVISALKRVSNGARLSTVPN